MVGCGLACPGGGGAGVLGCEFRGSGWGWDRRCQDPGARGLGPGGSWGTIPYGGGGGSNTEHGTIYIYIYIYVPTSNRQEQTLLEMAMLKGEGNLGNCQKGGGEGDLVIHERLSWQMGVVPFLEGFILGGYEKMQ